MCGGGGVVTVSFGVSLTVCFHQCSMAVFIYMLLLPEGRKDESCELSMKQRCVGDRRAVGRKGRQLFCFGKG